MITIINVIKVLFVKQYLGFLMLKTVITNASMTYQDNGVIPIANIHISYEVVSNVINEEMIKVIKQMFFILHRNN